MRIVEFKYYNFKSALKLVFMLLWMVQSCDSSDANDCFKTAGNQSERVVEVSEFSEVLINREIEAFVEQSSTYSVRIVSGDNLIEDVIATVENGRLIITDNNTCNFVRDYGITKVYISAPNLTEIRTSSQFDISSIGTLNYPSLNLVSEDFTENDVFSVGDFKLTLNSENVRIVSNNVSSFYLDGLSENLSVSFFSGVGRLEAANLICQHIDIFQRGSNDMIINPIQSLTGEIRGTGDVLSYNKPPEVDVDELYTGRLIFLE